MRTQSTIALILLVLASARASASTPADSGAATPAEIRAHIEHALARSRASGRGGVSSEIQVPPETPKGWEVTIAPADEPGPRFVMSGRIIRPNGAPLAGVNVFVYHADRRGWYAPPGSNAKWPRLHGVLRTDRDGRYRVRSVFPGSYGFLPHVHFVVWGKGLPKTGLAVNVFPPIEDRDSTLRHLAAEGAGRSVVANRDASGTLILEHDVVVSPTPPPGAPGGGTSRG